VSTISHPVTGAKIYKIALPAKKPTQALPLSIQNAIQKIQLPIQTASQDANSGIIYCWKIALTYIFKFINQIKLVLLNIIHEKQQFQFFKLNFNLISITPRSH
jgi:hypothetical protein